MFAMITVRLQDCRTNQIMFFGTLTTIAVNSFCSDTDVCLGYPVLQ